MGSFLLGITVHLDSAVDSPVNNVPQNGREDLRKVPVHQYSTPQPWAGKFCQETYSTCQQTMHVLWCIQIHMGAERLITGLLLRVEQKLSTLP